MVWFQAETVTNQLALVGFPEVVEPAKTASVFDYRKSNFPPT